MMFATEVASCN